MKYIVLIPDGSADAPRPELGGRTPLEAAETPNLDLLAGSGETGSAITIPEVLPAGSDVANLAVMGYDPRKYYTGRAPLEAASLGLDLGAGEIAFRCNLVHVEDGTMSDFSAGHIDDDDAASLVKALQEELGGGPFTFHPGLSYRNIVISKSVGAGAQCTPPHDISGQEVEPFLPRGDGAEQLRELMEAAGRILDAHPLNDRRRQEGKPPANMIWLWGQGTAPSLPTIEERFGVRGAVISAVDLVKGLGKYAGLEAVDVPGATGFLDTDYGAKAKSALAALADRDFAYVHVEAPDEASHMGDTSAKVQAIERIDSRLLSRLLRELKGREDFRMLVMPDHATPLEIRTHSSDPVPFLLFDSRQEKEIAGSFREEAEPGASPVEAWHLMARLLEREPAV